MTEMKIVTTEDRKRRFKSACANQGQTMSEVANALIDAWLSGQVDLQDIGQDTGQDK